MRDAMRAHGRQRRIKPARAESADLFQCSSPGHCVEARVYARVKFVARRRDEKPRAFARVQKGAARGAWKLASGFPVASNTSSARRMRCGSLSRSRAAVSGSNCASSA